MYRKNRGACLFTQILPQGLRDLMVYLVSVGVIWGASEFASLPLGHLDHTFVPTLKIMVYVLVRTSSPDLNDATLAEREDKGLASVAARVELGAVGKSARVVHTHDCARPDSSL